MVNKGYSQQEGDDHFRMMALETDCGGQRAGNSELSEYQFTSSDSVVCFVSGLAHETTIAG